MKNRKPIMKRRTLWCSVIACLSEACLDQLHPWWSDDRCQNQTNRKGRERKKMGGRGGRGEHEIFTIINEQKRLPFCKLIVCAYTTYIHTWMGGKGREWWRCRGRGIHCPSDLEPVLENPAQFCWADPLLWPHERWRADFNIDKKLLDF